MAIVQKGGSACHSEIDARTCDLRLSTQHKDEGERLKDEFNSAPSTQHSALNAGIVNNQRKSVWQFRCTYTHSVWDGPAEHRSCPIS